MTVCSWCGEEIHGKASRRPVTVAVAKAVQNSYHPSCMAVVHKSRQRRLDEMEQLRNPHVTHIRKVKVRPWI